MKLFESFLLEYPLLDITQEVSETYGEIKFQLFKKGVNLPENDLWIAATAIKKSL